MQRHFTSDQLRAGLDHVRDAPADAGRVELIVRRPAAGEREVLERAELCTEKGLLGDNWLSRGSRRTDDGSAHPEMQLNLMNARAAQLISGSKELWPLAGDQFYLDLDLSEANLPPGTRLHLGEAVIEITAVPHLGCLKFRDRFGADAVAFVNSDVGKSLHLRGLNAKVITPGRVSVGDPVAKLAP